MQVFIQTRSDNSIKTLCTNSLELRHKRMSRKLSFFFDLIKHDSRFAKNNKSKGKYMPVFVTLTYRDQKDWDPKHISALIDRYRKHFAGKKNGFGCPIIDFRYVWVAELQKRGVIHYHLCLWMPRFKKLADLKPDLLGWWKHGFSNVTAVRKSVFAYLSKYLGKGITKGIDEDGKEVFHSLPKGSRIFGMGGLTPLERVKTAYKLLPKWVKGIFIDDEVRVKRVVGGFEQGKVFLKSPYYIHEELTAVGKVKLILYDKAWSLISDKENEITWDYLKSINHVDTNYDSFGCGVTPDMSIWAEFNARVTLNGR